jgi:carboxylesterase type B
MHLLGDAFFVMPSVFIAETLAARDGRVWFYQFDWIGGDARKRALHASDQAFFFGNHHSAGARMLTGSPRDDRDCEERDALSLQMQDALVNFVRTGDPDPGGALWPSYGNGHVVLHFDLPRSTVSRHSLDTRWNWWRANIYAPAYPGL